METPMKSSIKGKKFMIPTLKNLWVEMRYGWEMR